MASTYTYLPSRSFYGPVPSLQWITSFQVHRHPWFWFPTLCLAGRRRGMLLALSDAYDNPPSLKPPNSKYVLDPFHRLLFVREKMLVSLLRGRYIRDYGSIWSDERCLELSAQMQMLLKRKWLQGKYVYCPTALPLHLGMSSQFVRSWLQVHFCCCMDELLCIVPYSW